MVGFGAGSTPTYADPKPSSRAAQLSAALEGTLDSEIGEAGALDRPVDFSSIVRRPGRTAEYRRRVASEMQLTAKAGS